MADEDPAPDPPRPSRAGRLRRAAGATGRGVRVTGAATAHGAQRVGGATGRGARYVVRQARRASHAEGAGESGLARLIELHAFNAAGDAAVAISLAGTLFFQVPTEQARGQVALFLALTMLPFAVVAPLIGPVLDRFGRGRRWAVGTTMAVRAFLCWVLADAVGGESIAMFPAALGVLVSSKAYGVTRAAAVPRLAPERLGLVKANSRISLAGIVGAGVSAPLALLASLAGPEWSLRYAFAVFVGGTILAILLPARADEPGGEESSRVGRRRALVPALVVRALRCNAGLRLLSGFLTLYMAFLIRVEPLPGWEDRPALLLGLVIGAAGLGNTIGIALGSMLRNLRAEVVVVVVLIADTVAVVGGALFYGLLALVALGLTAGVSQSLGKLSLDALIQRDVPGHTRASAFARSETLLQLSWVLGGFLGIALPLVPRVGLGTAALLLVAVACWVVAGVRRDDPAPA
ncbi:MFS transporter [Nocardioides marmoribigeumensis]|uniref:MFS family permease n=1 Tax=Nocardioides marmoribigeumensis TaxID=433649 RepID=A0ABU2BSH3_9ACTN|nr:MFS transporter [Nocardioides marmoribigeumensis]MDR7361575.1 MFS family permease [Nocardioides marmoribigeumensis]